MKEKRNPHLSYVDYLCSLTRVKRSFWRTKEVSTKEWENIAMHSFASSRREQIREKELVAFASSIYGFYGMSFCVLCCFQR